MMDESHSPDSSEWSNSVALCAVMKDENIDDVTEWLAYYRCAFWNLLHAARWHTSHTSTSVPPGV